MKVFLHLIWNKHFLLKCLFMIIVFMLMVNLCQAQNSSYNLNSIPIAGSNSVGIGNGVLSLNTGTANTAIGYYSLSSNSSGGHNTAVGYYSLYSNKTGSYNTALGRDALQLNLDGFENVALGYRSLRNNTTGYCNVASGVLALSANTSGYENVANGYMALYANTTGHGNTASGRRTLFKNSTGINNTGTGFHALYYNSTGGYNTATGTNSLHLNETGKSNTATGYSSAYFNTTGEFNTAYGTLSLLENKKGHHNTAIGDSAGYSSLGSGNIYLGSKAGALETGSNKMYIGNGENNTLIYGDMATGQVLIGKPDATGFVFDGNRKLNVVGGILTDSITVLFPVVWPDYVFRETYSLKPLVELKQFIMANKHLPGIPSAATIAAKGQNLGEMNARLLEKVEELTLYILQQQDNIDLLRQELNEMKGEIKRVKEK